MNSRLSGQLNIASYHVTKTLPFEQWFLQAATKGETALRTTVCFSLERARPRDAADVYIKTSNGI